MCLKKKEENLLKKSIESLNNTLQEGNFLEWSYILRK